MVLAVVAATVNIRFTSTLTTEDENAIAPVVLRAIASILDLFPIAYSIQIDTADARVFQHSRAASHKSASGAELRTLKARLEVGAPGE
jgi:hypothetical protein